MKYLTRHNWIPAFALIGSLFASIVANTSFAAEFCDLTCASKLASQIQTLREEVKNAIPIGTILPFSGANSLPQGYAPCNGKKLSRDTYPELFQTIGYSFTPTSEKGGSEFRIPDLQGRTLVGVGKGDGLTERNLGDSFGEERVSLIAAELPPHTHSGITDSENRTHSHPGTITNSDLFAGTLILGRFPRMNMPGNPGPGPAPAPPLNLNSYQPANGIDPSGVTHHHELKLSSEDRKHEHNFRTNGGDGLNGESHENMQPSTAVIYMIRIQ